MGRRLMSDNTSNLKLCIVINPAFELHRSYGGFYSYLQARGYEITAVAGSGEPDHAKVRALGIRTHVVPMERYPSPLRDLRCLVRLWSFFRHEKFDVVQVSTPKASLLGIFAACLAGQRNIMYLVRGRAYECKHGFPRWIYGRLDAICCQLADMVVPVSASLRESLIREHICSPRKLRMVGSGSSQGIDVDAFGPSDDILNSANNLRRSLGIGADATLVLFVGWVRREKGIIELVEAIRTLRAQGAAIHLLVLGSDHEPDDLDMATRHTIAFEPGFHRHEWTSDTVPFYHASDLVVLPSWREGFPRVMLEAAAAGRPVITTDVIGCRDSVQSDVTGLLVPVCDVAALTCAIRSLHEDRQRREAMGLRAVDRVRAEFSQRDVWGGTELLFCELARQSRQ